MEMDTDEPPAFREDESMRKGFSLREFGEPRLREILMLSEAINEPPAKGQLFQRLPKHMRRRQMSHHQSRLPSKLRSSLGNQGKEPVAKRPRRKHRRKPGNIAENFAARAEKNNWLETHVWHAKRFHMIDYCGFRIANRPTNKGFRACYRACRSHCLIIDLSYMHSAEITGPEEELISIFQKFTKPEDGRTIAAASFRGGLREGKIILCDPSDQMKTLSVANYLWSPDSSATKRKLFLWMHPASNHRNFYTALCSTLGFQQTEDNLYKSASGSVTLLRNAKLNRFRLSGPLASSVLADTLTAAPVAKTSDWPTPYCSDNWESQKLLMDRLKNTPPSLFPSYCVLGLLVTDPRFSAPSQRIKSQITETQNRVLDWTVRLAWSVIWDPLTRQAVSNSYIKDWEVNKTRRGFVVPSANSSENQPSIPILLIQQPGSQTSFGAGWDVVIPEKWGMPFWRSFILRGARPGGLQELHQVSIESQDTFSLPQLDYLEFHKENEKQLQDAYFRLPPAKRPSFIKLGISEPFNVSVGIAPNSFYVLRNLNELTKLDNAVKNFQTVSANESIQVVPVWLKCKKGRIEKFARIYFPTELDYEKEFDLKEPVHKDVFKKDRRILRELHKKKLAKLRRLRKKLKNGEKVDLKEEDSSYDTTKHWLSFGALDTSRRFLGSVLEAGYSHRIGSSVAQGFIEYSLLTQVINFNARKRSRTLLVRNINSSQYLRCSFSI